MIVRIDKYGADWCGPCKVLDKTLDQVTDIVIVRHNVDEEEDAMQDLNIKNIPVLIFSNDEGVEVHRTVGAISLAKIKEIITYHNHEKETYDRSIQ